MADDGLQIRVIFADDLRSFFGYERVAGAVEAVSADLVILIIAEGQGVHISFGGHGLMESGIKYGYHGRAGHQLLAGCHADQVGGVVQRRQVRNIFDRLDDFVIDHDRRSEGFAAVDDAVADRADLVEGLDHAGLVIHQGVDDQADGYVMIRNSGIGRLLARAVFDIFISDGTVDADSLAEALGQEFFRDRVDYLEFQ